MNLNKTEIEAKQKLLQWLQNNDVMAVDCILDLILHYSRCAFEFCIRDKIYDSQVHVTSNNNNSDDCRTVGYYKYNEHCEQQLTYSNDNDCRDITIRLIESGICHDMIGIYILSFRINVLSHDCIRFGIMSDNDLKCTQYKLVGNIIGGYIDSINRWQDGICYDNITGNIIGGKIWNDNNKAAKTIQQGAIVKMMIDLNANRFMLLVYSQSNENKNTKNNNCENNDNNNNNNNNEMNINDKSAKLLTTRNFSLETIRKKGKIHPFVTVVHNKDSVTLISVEHKI